MIRLEEEVEPEVVMVMCCEEWSKREKVKSEVDLQKHQRELFVFVKEEISRSQKGPLAPKGNGGPGNEQQLSDAT